MKLEEIHQIAILGAGLMGHGIAQSFIAGGYPVILYDIQESVLDSAEAHIKNSLELFCGAGLIENKDIGPALGRLTCTVDLKQAVKEADYNHGGRCPRIWRSSRISSRESRRFADQRRSWQAIPRP